MFVFKGPQNMYELRYTHSVLLANGYPENFISCHSKVRPHLEKTVSVPKKAIFINLPFKGDQIMQLTTQRLRSAIKRTFYAASLTLTCRTFSIPIPTIKDEILPQTVSTSSPAVAVTPT